MRVVDGVSLTRHARRELERSKQLADPAEAALAKRQAAEKAWGYVCEEVSRVTGITLTGPEAHKERKNVLGELDSAAGTSLLGDYEQLERRLHGDCEARCPLPEVERGVATAEQFPRRLAEALRRLRR